MSRATDVTVRRLGPGDRELARRTFAMMVEVFGEPSSPVGDAYLDRLLAREDFWALAALEGDEPVGGLTGHALPMTRAEVTELLVYDLAVRADRQRRGVGRALMRRLVELAGERGIHAVFLEADDVDDHALAFYRAIGGAPEDVTNFTFYTGA